MTIVAFLVGLVGPLMARWLTSVGLSLVVMAGLVGAIDALKSTALSNIGGMPLDGVQLAGLFGLWECLGMVFGTLTFCVTWASTKGFWTLAKT